MYVIRPVTQNDLDALEQCTLKAGLGFTHLPRNRDVLAKRIEASVNSLAKEVKTPVDEEYIFVLEDLENKKIVGTCGIYSRTGTPDPFYVYRIEELLPTSPKISLPKEHRLLRLSPYVQGPSEICGLYLLPEFRKEGLGKLLSFSRFHFMASHLERFQRETIANMRGVIDNGISPFWEGVGKRFIDVDLTEVRSMRADNNHFVHDVFPPYPIMVALLPSSVTEVLGKVHQNTIPAVNMLMAEGFQFSKEIDPVDGGPILICETNSIRAISKSVLVTIHEVSDHPIESESYLVSNTRLDFRACYGSLSINSEKKAVISEELAKALQVQPGDTIRYSKLTM